MKVVQIGEISRIVRSWNPAAASDEETFTYIDISSVSQERKLVEVGPPILTVDAPSRARQLVEADDILVSTVRPNLNAVARVPPELDGATASTGFCVLRPAKSLVDPGYLFHWVRSPEFVSEMIKLATGQSYPAVSDKIIKGSKIPLPSLEVQKRIAAILDQADALRSLRARALDRLNALGQAIFHEMFGGEANAPLKCVSEFAEVKGGKRLPKGSDYSDEVTPHPYIRVSDLGNLKIDTSSIKYISPEIQKSVSRYIVAVGDVVISIAGSIGITAAVPDRLNGANLTENAAKITPKEGGEFDPIYLSWALSMPEAKSQIMAKTGQVTIGKLALFRIEQIEIPMPSIERQRAFSRAIRELDASVDIAQNASDHLGTLFTSLQHRAFRGEL